MGNYREFFVTETSNGWLVEYNERRCGSSYYTDRKTKVFVYYNALEEWMREYLS